MDDKSLIVAACAMTGDPVEAVVDYRLAGDSLTVLINRGIKGTIKLTYQTAALVPVNPPVSNPAQPEPARPEPKPRQQRRK